MDRTPTALPTGTLTLLFTDVEGSTQILARLGPRYADVISAQRAILRAAFARWDGLEMGTEGDSFFVVFRRVGDAVAAAVQAQRELAATTWPDGVAVRVRMGLHTGEPTPHEDGYVGMDVHRAARVAASAHGGQVVLTEATYRIAAGQEGVGFTDLGLHRLKDLPEPERLYGLVADGLPSGFPPPRSLGSQSTLPRPGTVLVGREDDLTALAEHLAGPDALTTLTGPGGTGKTRLAIAAAGAAGGRFRDGVFFVPLASATTADVMWTTVAEVLGVTGESKAPPLLREHLASREVLLVLDNLEQLPDAAGVVAGLLSAGPGVRVLATSRRPLHLTGEREYPVAPLPVPEPGQPPGGAVELFVHRAQLVRPGFVLDDRNTEDVVEICRRLDGLPLAVELVAARSKLLGPRALRARLDDALEVSTGTVDVPERQQSLRSALAWSYRLLPEHLQHAFRQLGVLEGDFDLAAAEAVLATGGDALAEVGELVDVSLLSARDDEDGEPRLRMLGTVALYARDLLALGGEADAARHRHAEHYLGVAASWCPLLRTGQHLTARDRVERELGNLRAALGWALGPPAEDADPVEQVAVGLRLCEQLSWFWYGCGYPAEGRRWLQAAVDAAAGSRTREGMVALHGLAVLVLQQGDADRARRLLEVELEFWRAEGELPRLAAALNSLALARRALDDADGARALIQEATEVTRRAGDRHLEANALSNLAALEIDAGRSDAAIDLLRRVLALDTALGDAWGQGADHVNLAAALLRAGRLEEAREHLLRHAAAAVDLGDVEITIDVIDLFCALHARLGDAERAARLLGAAEAMRQRFDFPRVGPDAAWLDAALSGVRGRPDPATWQAQEEVGAAYGVPEAMAAAMGARHPAR